MLGATASKASCPRAGHADCMMANGAEAGIDWPDPMKVRGAWLLTVEKRPRPDHRPPEDRNRTRVQLPAAPV